MDLSIASLVLPYIDSERAWVMLAARTNKALSAHLDANHHWEGEYSQLLEDLRSGRARFEITRYVGCFMSDPFYWDETDNLDEFSFSVSFLESSRQSFARQVVPQVKQALLIMEEWCDEYGEAEYTASEADMKPQQGGGTCKTTYHIGSIPLRVTDTPSRLWNGDLDKLSSWMRPPYEDHGYDTDVSWECECGESYSASEW
jgi:hypothetical protein